MMWEKMDAYYECMNPAIYFNGWLTNMACQNICINTKAPVGVEYLLLLGLGAKYCVKHTKLTTKCIVNIMD